MLRFDVHRFCCGILPNGLIMILLHVGCSDRVGKEVAAQGTVESDSTVSVGAPPIESSIDAAHQTASIEQRGVSRLQSGAIAPPIIGKDLDDKTISLQKEAMKAKYVLIDFWASWCAPCRGEYPYLRRVHARYRDHGLKVIGVNLDEVRNQAKAAVLAELLDYPHFFDGLGWESPVVKSYGVHGIPKTFLLNADLEIVAVDLRGDAMEAKLRDLLGAGNENAVNALEATMLRSRESQFAGINSDAFERALASLRKNGQGALATELASHMEQAVDEVGAYKGGYIVFGRIKLEGGEGDPRHVTSQMVILDDGWFVDVVKDLVEPVGFRLHGYLPLNVEMAGRKGGVIDVGTHSLSPARKDQQAVLKGRILLKGTGTPEDVVVSVRISNGSINTPSGGTSPRASYPEPIRIPVQASGQFEISGLSPTEYILVSTAPGHVDQVRRVNFKAGETVDVGKIVLESPQAVTLRYIVADRPDFDIGNEALATVRGGDPWKTTQSDYGWDLEFLQDTGKLKFRAFYAPCNLADLGPGRLEDFVESDLQSTRLNDAGQVPVRDGHVYIMKQGHFKHWVLFELHLPSSKRNETKRKSSDPSQSASDDDKAKSYLNLAKAMVSRDKTKAKAWAQKVIDTAPESMYAEQAKELINDMSRK